MKKILLTLLCLVAVGITNNAATIEKSYKLEFATGSADGTAISTATTVADQLSKGSEYVTGNFTATTNAYGKSKFGLKLGKSGGAGTVAFDLSDAGKVKVTAITINGAYYNNTKDANMYFDVIINGNSVGHLGEFKQDELSEKQLILDSPVLAESLKFVTGNSNGNVSSTNQARGYIKDLTIEYQEDAEGIQDPIFSNLPENYTLTAGQSVSFPKIEPSSLEYTFSVEPADLLTFDHENKTITANKIGTGTITFTTKEVEDTYNAGTGSFDVTVVGKRSRISFANQVVIGKLGTGVVWQIADVTVPEGVLGDGELVTYESSDPSIVSINEDTGRIKSLDLHQAGEVTITATFTPNEEYSEYAPAKASYTIIVKDPAATIEAGYSIFDFTTENPYGMTSYSTGTDYEANAENPVTEIVGNEDVVTVSFGEGNYRAWHTSQLDELRVMAGCKMKIEVPEGYKITKIGFVKGSNWNLSYDPASKTINNSDKESGEELAKDFDYVWMPASDSEAVSVVNITSSDGRSDIRMIEVLYDAAGSEMKSADLSFTKNVYGIIVDETATINAVNNPENREIKYTIDGLNDDEYLIEEKDNHTLDIVVSKTGSYTLRATSLAGDGYRDGLAIMRLNVYRHVTVYKDDEELAEEHIISGENGCYITMDIHPSLNLYYKLEETKAEARAKVSLKAEDNEDIDENLEEGFEKYEDGINIPAGHEGSLHFYLANYGYKSPVRTMTIAASDVNTAIEEIEATVDGEIRYYDLSGREVKGMPENGVYVRLQGGKADKVIVK